DYVINGVKLFEAGADYACDCVVEVRAPLIVRLVRLLRRGDANFFQIIKRIYAQRKINYNHFRKTADIIMVDNFGNHKKLYRNLEKIMQKVGLKYEK
ncbi:MAG: hypothetical protein JXR63_10560, partial [Spirochaetales bacterium]|nr:hypothetical protein [Spirochaetales bacterium]